MSTQSEAKAHLDSMAGAARSYHEQEERIAALAVALVEARKLLRFAQPDEDFEERTAIEWEKRRNAWLTQHKEGSDGG